MLRLSHHRYLLALVLSAMLAACSSTGSGSSAETISAAPSAAGTAAGDAGGLEAACSAAQEAGATVSVWSQDPEITQETHRLFRERYPGIETSELDIRPEDITQRILSESTAGRDLDVDIIVGTIPAFLPLAEQGLIDTETDWTEYGLRESLISESNMVRSSRIPNGLVYNTDNLTADDLPDTWEEFIDPKWQERVVEDPRGRPFEVLATEWGEEKTLDYVQRLVDVVQPELIEGTTAGILAVASGELDVTINARSAENDEQQSKGAPVEIKYLDFIPTTDYYLAKLSDAPSPDAARCYMGWRIGEGAPAIFELNFQPNDDVPENAPEGATIVTIDNPSEVDFAAEMAAKVNEVLVAP